MSSRSSDSTRIAREHELEVVDQVVRGGGHARPEDATLIDFVMLVRATRPLPDHGAAMRLDQRLLGSNEPDPRRNRRRALLVTTAFVMLLGVVGIVGVNLDRISGQEGLSLGRPETVMKTIDNGGVALPDAAHRQPGLEEGLANLPTSKQSSFAVSSDVDRDVARTARLVLATPGKRIERVSDRVVAVVDAAHGYVASSNVRSTQGGRGRARFELMIPATKYQQTLARLSGLAHVRSRSQSTEDITTEFDGARRALSAARARVAAARAHLAGAESDAARASARHLLERAKFSERQALRRVRANQARVSFVPLELTIVADNSAEAADQNTIEKAIDRAGAILTGMLAALIVALAVLVPLGLVLAGVIFGLRRSRRVRHERVIDTAASQPE